MEHLDSPVSVNFARRYCNLKLPSLRAVRETEFEVQAWLYNELLRQGFKVRGEVCVRGKGGMPDAPKRRFQCRFDLVLYSDEEPFLIVEVKARPVKHKDGVESTRQARRYMAFGIPVTFVYGRRDAEHLVAELIGEKFEA